MFKKAEMEPLAKRNLRYRILKTEDEYYLLDVERPFLIVYFLPLLIYFVPHRCYEMSKEEYEQLSQSMEKNARLKEAFEKHGLGYGFGAGVGAMLLSRVFDINQFLNFNSAILSKILACIILMFVSVLRLWVTKFYKLPSEFQNKQYQKIYIFPRFFKKLLFFIFIYGLSVLFTLGGFVAIFSNLADNFIVHICLLMFGIFTLIAGNALFLHPLNFYWIK